jgi:hypothetical protein
MEGGPMLLQQNTLEGDIVPIKFRWRAVQSQDMA